MEVRAAELVLELGDLVDESVDGERITAECVLGDLPVENLDGRPGVVRSDLAPALRTLVGPHAHERDLGPGEALDRDDPHSSKTIRLRSDSPERASTMASSMRSSS